MPTRSATNVATSGMVSPSGTVSRTDGGAACGERGQHAGDRRMAAKLVDPGLGVAIDPPHPGDQLEPEGAPMTW